MTSPTLSAVIYGSMLIFVILIGELESGASGERFHQTLHFLNGLIGEPTGYFQSEANSGMLDSGPFARNLAGE